MSSSVYHIDVSNNFPVAKHTGVRQSSIVSMPPILAVTSVLPHPVFYQLKCLFSTFCGCRWPVKMDRHLACGPHGDAMYSV